MLRGVVRIHAMSVQVQQVTQLFVRTCSSLTCPFSVVAVCHICREKTTTLSGAVPAINTVAPWDGKDATLAVDEIPLDELFKEDL